MSLPLKAWNENAVHNEGNAELELKVRDAWIAKQFLDPTNQK